MHSLEQDRQASLLIGSRTPDHASQRAIKHHCCYGLYSRMQRGYDLPILAMRHPVIPRIGGRLPESLLSNHQTFIRKKSPQMVAEVRQQISANLTRPEQQHSQYLDLMRSIATTDTVWSGDACQLVYTGAFAFPVHSPRQWFYLAGYCALGNALPNAIGAKLAKPDTPVVVLAGDGGFMFTMPELVTAAELNLPIPIVI
jgi:thiamine pyrophosphate-dependent acetolactate synthase large subunit-like protein